MNKVLAITIKNSNHNLKPDNVVTNELTELNSYLDDGWEIQNTNIVTLETGGLYFTVIYHLVK